jgi:hypothetical protein
MHLFKFIVPAPLFFFSGCILAFLGSHIGWCRCWRIIRDYSFLPEIVTSRLSVIGFAVPLFATQVGSRNDSLRVLNMRSGHV